MAYLTGSKAVIVAPRAAAYKLKYPSFAPISTKCFPGPNLAFIALTSEGSHTSCCCSDCPLSVPL